MGLSFRNNKKLVMESYTKMDYQQIERFLDDFENNTLGAEPLTEYELAAVMDKISGLGFRYCPPNTTLSKSKQLMALGPTSVFSPNDPIHLMSTFTNTPMGSPDKWSFKSRDKHVIGRHTVLNIIKTEDDWFYVFADFQDLVDGEWDILSGMARKCDQLRGVTDLLESDHFRQLVAENGTREI
jgi:hypothetical protein